MSYRVEIKDVIFFFQTSTLNPNSKHSSIEIDKVL